MTDRFEVIGHVPALMATWLSKFLKRPTNCMRKSNNQGETSKQEVAMVSSFPANIFLKVTASLVVGCKRS